MQLVYGPIHLTKRIKGASDALPPPGTEINCEKDLASAPWIEKVEESRSDMVDFRSCNTGKVRRPTVIGRCGEASSEGELLGILQPSTDIFTQYCITLTPSILDDDQLNETSGDYINRTQIIRQNCDCKENLEDLINGTLGPEPEEPIDPQLLETTTTMGPFTFKPGPSYPTSDALQQKHNFGVSVNTPKGILVWVWILE